MLLLAGFIPERKPIMKKSLSLLLGLAFFTAVFGISACADEDLTAYAVANGVVSASSFDDLTAPFSGTLASFDAETGDPVQAGDVVFSMLTTPVEAPEDGTVRYLFAQEGESADAAMNTYGAVAALQPARRQRLECTYSGAANDEECRHLHVGEILYFKTDKEKGTGVVIATRENAYEVEVLTGKYDAGRILDLYRDSDYAYDNKTGSGKVVYREDVPVAASGVIAAVLVQPGDSVRKGDTLFTVVGQDAPFDASPEITARKSGVIGLIPVSSGQQVWKGQLLARVYHTDAPEIVAEVDEMDLHSLRVGDTVPVTLDVEESRVLTGTVTEISSLGSQRQNAAYFTVHISVEASGLRLGQSASVYLP